MRSEIRQVGNSKGIILPKVILEQCHLEEAVELKVIEGELVITPISKKRAGWEQAFKNFKHEKDVLVREWQAFSNESDEEDWVW